MDEVTRSRPRRWAQRAAFIAIWLIAGVLILEGAVRLLHMQPRPGPYDPNVPDAELGMRPLPNLAQKAEFPEYKGVLILRTNNFGFYQAKDTRIEPKDGVTRTAVLGDSFIAGASNAEDNIPSVLECILNRERPKAPVEVLDVGAGRYSPYQCFIRMQRDVLRLKPKHIIVAEYVGNDFLDMIRQDDRPYLVEKQDGTFEAHPPRFVTYDDPSLQPGLLDRSRLFAVLQGLAGPTIRYQFSRVKIMSDNLSEYGYGPGAIAKYLMEVAKLDRVAHGMMLQILNQQVWFDHFPETLQLSLRINRHVIQLFRDMCQQRGIRLTYTVIPSKDMIEPELMKDVFARLQQKDALWTPAKTAAFDNWLTDETMRACRELKVEYVDLRPLREKKKPGVPFYYEHDMHMGPEGNHAAAEVLAAGLLATQ
jgi:hypothetical protein